MGLEVDKGPALAPTGVIRIINSYGFSWGQETVREEDPKLQTGTFHWRLDDQNNKNLFLD